MIIFDGYQFVAKREQQLKERVAGLKAKGVSIVVAAILFSEDKGSQLYTGLKKQAAERVGIEYQVHTFSITDPVPEVIAKIQQLNQDPAVTGIIIQKPWRKTWESVLIEAGRTVENPAKQFSDWWSALVTSIDEQKDVDGLHPNTLHAIEQGMWKQQGKVMPATAKAVLSILESTQLLVQGNYVVLGKSDILGKPLAFELKNRGFKVELLGKRELKAKAETGEWLKEANVVISATGQMHLVTQEMVSPGVVLVDVGEPRPDIDSQSVTSVASFLTPVPGGVGPVTVVSLLENAVELAQ